MMLKPTCLHLSLATGLLLFLSALAQAQPSAHYVPGVEGIKGASLPPPGFYVLDYNVVYTADRADNSSGQRAGPANFNAFTYANVPRVVWISDLTFLGGSLGADALLPLVYQSVTAGPFSSSTFGVGDPFLEATLSWHPQQFDFAFGCGVWMPAGDSAAPLTTRAGLGYWADMFTAGATWYIDKHKTWAVSALTRYEFNGEQRDTDLTPGQAFTLEWGVSKTFHQTIDVGAVGYYQQQVTSDSGAGALANRDRVAAVGPEISAVIPKLGVRATLRYLYEFMAEDRAQGQTITLTLTKRF